MKKSPNRRLRREGKRSDVAFCRLYIYYFYLNVALGQKLLCVTLTAIVLSRVLEAVGFRAASTASTSALPLPIAVFLLVAIPPTKLEAPHRFQNPGAKAC